MPITKSAKKSLKVSETKRNHNKVQKVELEKVIRKASASNINKAISKIDKAAKRNIISKNKAARLKSSLAKKFGTPKAVKKAAATTAKKIRSTKSEARNKS